MNPREPKPTGELPPAPPRLSEAARAAYQRFAELLAGVATSMDAVALELIADTYAEYLDCKEKADKGGLAWLTTTIGDDGKPTVKGAVYSPYGCIARQLRDTLTRMLADFGMTPSSRSRVLSAPPQGEIDPLEKLMERKAKRKA
jgi:P27 family predicted phage terminase small subunit